MESGRLVIDLVNGCRRWVCSRYPVPVPPPPLRRVDLFGMCVPITVCDTREGRCDMDSVRDSGREKHNAHKRNTRKKIFEIETIPPIGN